MLCMKLRELLHYESYLVTNVWDFPAQLELYENCLDFPLNSITWFDGKISNPDMRVHVCFWICFIPGFFGGLILRFKLGWT